MKLESNYVLLTILWCASRSNSWNCDSSFCQCGESGECEACSKETNPIPLYVHNPTKGEFPYWTSCIEPLKCKKTDLEYLDMTNLTSVPAEKTLFGDTFLSYVYDQGAHGCYAYTCPPSLFLTKIVQDYKDVNSKWSGNTCYDCNNGGNLQQDPSSASTLMICFATEKQTKGFSPGKYTFGGLGGVLFFLLLFGIY